MKAGTFQTRTHWWLGVTGLLVLFAQLGVVRVAKAEERKFLVILANSPKQYPGPDRDPLAQPSGGLPPQPDIDKQYFDQVDPTIGSHAEYWEEISYGDIILTGATTGWVTVPWAIQPPLIDSEDDDPEDGPDDDADRNTPKDFFDLNNDTQYAYGAPEGFDTATAAVVLDTDGDPFGFDNGPFLPGPGGGHLDRINNVRDVYKPGERFVDVDGDGRWDGLDETANVMDHNADGEPDGLGPWVDLNNDGIAQSCDWEECGGEDIYLADSDNDGNPDCCPDGAPNCGKFHATDPPDQFCPPTTWQDGNGNTIIDCNGNLIDDAIDIDNGTSVDKLPFTDNGGTCSEGDGDGVPDECQVLDSMVDCREEDETCEDLDEENDGACCSLPVCEFLEDLGIDREPVQRCEFADSNCDDAADMVEPFENFMRRWDPCIFDSDSTIPGDDQLEHWIKVYDPSSPGGGSCSAPMYSVTYEDPSYIEWNYPGDVEALKWEATSYIVYGNKDPDNLLGGACVCADGSACGDRTAEIPQPDGSIVEVELVGNYCPAGVHAVYNPPDTFTNQISDRGPGGKMLYTTKMQAAGGGGGQASFAATSPEPGSGYPNAPAGEQAWYPQAWADRYALDWNGCMDVDDNVDPANCEAPAWPQGFDPMGEPQPGGPPGGATVANTLRMLPYLAVDADAYDPEVHRRYFKANFGGVNGNGSGMFGDPFTRDNLNWETGPVFASFEEDFDAPIMPEEVNGASQPAEFFDGWVEHDDLPSSRYHKAGDEWLGEITSPLRSWVSANGTPLTDYYSAVVDGEEPDAPNRRVPAIWGHDKGNNDPNSPPLGGDMITTPGGPLAVKTHGQGSTDAGNVLLLELLTWRTSAPANNGWVWERINGTGHPYAGPGPGADMLNNANMGFRDYNLDGMVDLGEVRNAGSDNYLVDPFPGSGNEPGTGTEYPWNRRRLIEDCVEVLDASLDFDEFVDPNAMARLTCPSGAPLINLVPPQYQTDTDPDTVDPQDVIIAEGVISGIVLLPPGAHDDNDFPRATSFTDDFGNWNVIHNEDNIDPAKMFPADGDVKFSWNIIFHELPKAIGSAGENPTSPDDETYQTAYAAHEYLHSWEGFPDLYDYDVFGTDQGLPINCPIGGWDIMAGGGLVHPVPILKENACTDWIEPVDITGVVTPGVDKSITLPRAEFVRDDSYYFLENPDRLGERYYFWYAGVGFDEAYPTDGVLVLHTDTCFSPTDPDDCISNPDAIPQQQLSETRFTYLIVQADGLNELQAGTDCMDDGDPWPGSSGNDFFGFETVPPSRWYALNAFTGMEITFNQQTPEGAVVVVNWVPTSIPSLKFVDPPGGVSVGDIYNVRYRSTDVFGGTWIQVFYTADENDLSIAPDGSNYIGTKKKVSTGTIQQSQDWNIDDVPDGQYKLFARLVPATGQNGQLEQSYSTPRPGRQNAGSGEIEVIDVDVSQLLAGGTGVGLESGVLIANNQFQAIDKDGFLVNFDSIGVQVGDLVTMAGVDIPLPTLRSVSAVNGETLTLSSPVQDVPIPAFSGTYSVTRGGSAARLETWTAESIDSSGLEWKVFGTITQPEPPDSAEDQDPYPHAFTCTVEDQADDPTCADFVYTSLGGEVQFVIKETNAADPDLPAVPFELGDTFSFVTTGTSALSAELSVIGGQINENPIAIITFEPLTGQAPLTVTFDGRDSIDPNGANLTYEWDFGDGSPPASGDVVEHTFTQALTFTVTLKVTNPDGLFGEDAVDVVVINNSPNAVITASPTSGPTPLNVEFSGSQSSDTETPAANLIYQWDFGDGESANAAGEPGFIDVTHFYATEGEYTAKLTVTDAGGKQDTATKKIVVGNTNPTPVVFTSNLSGPTPLTITVNAINSFDADGDPLTVTWFWDDGSPSETYPIEGPDGTGTVTHTYELPEGQAQATFKVTATVMDDTNGSADWSGANVTVLEPDPNSSIPQANFTVSPNPPLLNEAFTADASASFDRPNFDPVASYSWDWGDGTTETTTDPVIEHTYTEEGEYDIILEVADADDPPNTHVTVKAVVVGGGGDDDDDDDVIDPTNQNPVPTMIVTPASQQGVAGLTMFTFDASDSFDPDGAEQTASLSFAWEFGDGSFASGAETTHVYDADGIYTVRLTVSDTFNASAVLTTDVTIVPVGTNSEPTAVIATGIRSGTAPVTLTFDGRQSFDPDGDPLSYSWEIALEGVTLDPGNINPSADESLVTYNFTSGGTYTVVLTVTDTFGLSDTAGPISVQISEVGTTQPDDNDDDDDDPGQQIPDSSSNRPGRFCGFGMAMSLFGSLLGLSVMLAGRRRFRA